MNNNITVYMPTWDFLLCDLDAISYISQILRKQSITGYSYTLIQDAYTVLCLFKYFKRKDPKRYWDISVKTISQHVYFGKSEKKDIQNIKKVLKLLTKLKFDNSDYKLNSTFDFNFNDKLSPILTVQNRTGDIKTVFVDRSFDNLINEVEKDKSEHNTLRITSRIYKDYLSKIKKEQRAYSVFLEKLFQESKAYLERSTFSIQYNRQHITLQRIKNTFDPKKKHTAKEIYDSGEKLLKKIFGNNIDGEIQKLVDSIITDDDRKKFIAKKKDGFNSSIKTVSHLFTEQSANDKDFSSPKKEIRK